MNRCPIVHIKPVYRVRLNSNVEIKLTVTDPDGDITKCEKSKQVEAGDAFRLSGSDITVETETCTVSVNATSTNGYKDKDMIPVTLTLKDFNRNPITMMKTGGKTSTLQPNLYYLGYSTVEFVVQVVENLETPDFIAPTLEHNKLFIMEFGATWKTAVFATSNSKIVKYTPYGFVGEKINATQTQLSNKDGMEIQWTPTINDVGSHVICVKAIDENGVESEMDRCFKIIVQNNKYNHSTAINTNKPRLINVPSPGQLVACKIDVTCLLPIYVSSSTIIQEVHLGDFFVDNANIGTVESLGSSSPEQYIATLEYSHPTFGKNEICFYAVDISGIRSDVVCISTFIQPPDPCLSAPCLNVATCESNMIEGTFSCQCMSGFTGRNCEKHIEQCNPNPCEHGECTDRRTKYYCTCEKGYTGKNCEINIDDCIPNACNSHGICKDGVANYSCNCYARWNDPNYPHCSNDICKKLHLPETTTSCPADGCYPDPCSGRGYCSSGGSCTCSLGYDTDDVNCTDSIVSLNVTGIEFVQPSPKNRSEFICMTPQNADCKMTLYLSHGFSGIPTVTVSSTTDQLKPFITAAPAIQTTVLEGIDNLYSVEINIPTKLAETKQQFACFTATTGASKATVCYEFKFATAPSTPMTYDFIAPSLAEGTTVKCNKDERCTMLLFTNPIPTNQSCEDVISPTPGIMVIRTTTLTTTSCVTEVTYTYPTAGHKQINFQFSYYVKNLRKYELEVLEPNSDPCDNYPCQNNGHCFPDKPDKGGIGYHCICPTSYVGKYCEKGPCQTNTCHNNAYCQVNNGTEVCICQVGFHGSKCESSIQPGNENQLMGVAEPKAITCVVYQPCTFTLFATSPSVAHGYISYVLQMNHIQVTKQEDSKNYLIAVQIVSKKAGTHDACIQIFDSDKVNKDEVCVKVNAVTDMSSLYGQKNLPHFVGPSQPADSHVVCIEGQPCHVIYRITSGDSNNSAKLTALATKDVDFDTYYVFSDCQSSADGAVSNNCTLDVSIVIDETDIGVDRTFCIQASMETGVTGGEERCFDLTVVNSTIAPVGCQVFECLHGGFCDGHDPSKPICYCKRGYSGLNCETPVKPEAVYGSVTQTHLYVGQLGLPAEIMCLVKQVCVIPFQMVADPVQTQVPEIFLGYVDPSIPVESPSFQEGSKSNGVYFGSTTGVALTTGVFKVCLQSYSDKKTLIEMCLDIVSVDSIVEEVDLTKPHFIEPTVPTDTLLYCEVSKACHIDIHFTNGDAFNFPGECPQFTETSPHHFEGLHVFESEYGTTGCASDVAYIPTSVNVTETFCIQLAFPGKKGENRCFRIQVVSDLSQNVTHPCTDMQCNDHGKCIADFTTTPAGANCICNFGYDGVQCEKDLLTKRCTDEDKGLEKRLDNGQHFDENSAVPNVTRCFQKDPKCCVTVPYYGVKDRPPVVKDMNVESVAQTPDPCSNRHIAEICWDVEDIKNEDRLCIQTTNDGKKDGLVTDETCFAIEMVTRVDLPSQALPHFIDSFTNGSRMSCHADSSCHVSMVTGRSTSDSSCEQVMECDGGFARSYVYPTQDIDEKCVTDIAVKTGTMGQSDEVCLTAGVNGEQRVLQFEAACPVEFGHCTHSHCYKMQECFTAKTIEALCVCDKEFTVVNCEQVNITKSTVTDEDWEIARNNTIQAGGCYCFIKERKDKASSVGPMVASAGVGAGGMASAMGIGGVIFGVIKKIKKMKNSASSVTKITPAPKLTPVKSIKK